MNFKRLHGIVYHKMKSVQDDNLLIYKPVPAPIDKIKNKYRYRMIVKGKVNAKLLDRIKDSIQEETIQKMKNTSIMVDINPNNFM